MKWIEFIKRDDNCKLRLFCFHHSGGGASFFYPWAKSLPQNLELAAIQLPGRETRFNEPFIKNMKDVINKLIEEFIQLLDKPFLLLGHSIGALICFELTRKFQSLNLKMPEHLIVSGCRAPHIPLRRKPINHLPRDMFISELMKYNGIPQKLLEDTTGVLDLFLPIIKADFTIADTYLYSTGAPFSCDITAINGKNDSTVYENDVQQWSCHTSFNFNYFSFPGDHFFIRSAQTEVLLLIEKIIKNISLRAKTLK